MFIFSLILQKKIFGYFGYMFTLVKSIYTTNTDFSKRCRRKINNMIYFSKFDK